MPVFETMEDLEDSLLSAGLAAKRAEITATARPVIAMSRTEEFDDTLPRGTSKVGGDPDLPRGFKWPTRPPRPDAGRWAEAERRQGARRRDQQGDSIPAVLDAITRQYDDRAECHLRTFPLAFQAQLNLAELSTEDGFDPDLPTTGLLSIFADVTGHGGSGLCAFWHKGKSFARRPSPLPVADWYDLSHGPRVLAPGEFWETQTMAEVLTPYSAICVPDHWFTTTRSHKPGKRLLAWQASPTTGYRLPTASDPATHDYGDRLGGWPHNLQGNPEDEVADDAEQIARPGATPWRHLFCWGGEHGADTRLVPWGALGDGNASVLIRETDLVARRFEKAVTVIQRT